MRLRLSRYFRQLRVSTVAVLLAGCVSLVIHDQEAAPINVAKFTADGEQLPGSLALNTPFRMLGAFACAASVEQPAWRVVRGVGRAT